MFASLEARMSTGHVARLATGAAVLMLVILAMSATIRLGQGGCGQAAAPDMVIAAARGIHRISASVVGVLLLAMAWFATRARSVARGQAVMFVALFGLTFFLAVLGKFGANKTLPAITIGNIVAGMAMAALFWRLRTAYIAHQWHHEYDQSSRLLAFARLLIAAQILIGSWLAGLGVSAGCGAAQLSRQWIFLPGVEAWQALISFDAAGNYVLPVIEAMSWLRTWHVVVAMAASLAVIALSLRFIRRGASAAGIILLMLLGAQALFALVQLAAGTHWYLGVPHNIAAALLLAALTGFDVERLAES